MGHLRTLCLILLYIGFINVNTISGQTIKTYEEGPIHEAFVVRVSGNIIMEVIPSKPPESIKERKPRQLDMQSTWVSGYWAWEDRVNDFVWVSGVWRRPPPKHQWVSGFWRKYDEEWVWIHGFWSQVSLQNIDYIGVPPPDPIDENTAPPPDERYFWVSGYWTFLFDTQEYRWISGHWEELDANWIFVPAHYVWRPGGYVFVPAYWDWALENRGTAYSSVLIEPDYRNSVVFEPILILRPPVIVRHLFVYYPDYLSFFRHYWHFHPEFWEDLCCAPPWWVWDTWWCFSWHDHWGLWWWYSHPGYPQPSWLNVELSSILSAPLSELLSMFDKIHTPPIVTPNGVASREKLLQAIRKSTGDFAPIVPHDPKIQDKIFSLARPGKINRENVLKPLGRRLPVHPSADRPRVRKPVVDSGARSRVSEISETLRPTVPLKPKIPSHRRPNIWQPPSRPHAPVYIPSLRKPTWTPKTRRPPPPVYEPSASGQPEREPDHPPRSSHWRPRMERPEPPVSRPHIHRSPKRST